jgi:glycine/D-amino acid oxidase-like deaminating enzyme
VPRYEPTPASDVIVIGAGMVGAACALYASRAGLSVTVLDRAAVGGGTTGAGEGNLLVSDKAPGPELDLALRSQQLWRALAAADDRERGGRFGARFEHEAKGGLVVAAGEADLRALRTFAAAQHVAGVTAEFVDGSDLKMYEPELAPGFAGGFFYPEDAQVMPSLAAVHLLRLSGARVLLGRAVTGLLVTNGAVRGVRTPLGELSARFVVNAAGFAGAAVAELAGSALPIQPRRGFVLVTEPLPPLIRHKVYSAAYVSDVASDAAGLQSSAVVEGTAAGPVLIGATRERVGLDRTPSYPALGRLAAQAAELFPFLAPVRIQRHYTGFRPYLPDHLPAVGADPEVSGLYHACGHEGAGIGLAPATGELIADLMTGTEPRVDPAPFAPGRFAGGGAREGEESA